MADFKQIDEARQLIGLEEDATLDEIKKAYRKLAHKYHPDRCKDEKKIHCEKMIKRINHAYEVIMSYCASHEYSFKEDDIKDIDVNKEYYQHMKRFYDGWLGSSEL